MNGASTARTMILVRATTPSPRTLAFADGLSTMSPVPVTLLLDERGGAADVGDRARVGLTEPKCRALGLYCPSDFAWRCGDYGLYLARAQYPAVERFWLIEDDVRILGRDPASFFRQFEAVDADLLAADLKPADAGWYWRKFARHRGGQAVRCLFPVLRVSAGLIDGLLAKRVEQSRRLLRRLLWPNDESFVATTASLSGASCIDLNASGRTVYDDESFSFFHPRRDEAPPNETRDAILYHPMLSDDAYDRKVARLSAMTRPQPLIEQYWRRALGRINAHLPW